MGDTKNDLGSRNKTNLNGHLSFRYNFHNHYSDIYINYIYNITYFNFGSLK